MTEGLLGESVHGVTIQSQECEGADPGECVGWKRAEKIEPEIKNLQSMKVCFGSFVVILLGNNMSLVEIHSKYFRDTKKIVLMS